MAKIFISHSSRDKERARQIASDLRELGHDPWLDEWEIRVGDCIVTGVQSALAESDYVVVLLTRASVNSSWVDREWKAKYWAEIESDRVRVLPCLMEDCDIPELLRSKRYADFRTSYGVGFVHLGTALNPTVQTQLVSVNAASIQTKSEDAEVSALLSKVHGRRVPLAECIAEALALAQQARDSDLEGFCRSELTGYTGATGQKHPHRLVQAFLSPMGQINPSYFGWNGNPSAVIDFIRSNPDQFFPRKLMLSEAISKIEKTVTTRTEKTALMVLQLRHGDVSDTAKNPSEPITCYLPADAYETLLENVRVELTNKLVALLPSTRAPGGTNPRPEADSQD